VDPKSDEPEKGHAFIADGQGGRPTPYYRALAAGLAGERRGRVKRAKGPGKTAGEVRARADGLAEARRDRWTKSPDRAASIGRKT